MKQSDIYKQQAAEEDNDLKALGLQTKAIREYRSEKFDEVWLPVFKEKFNESFFYDSKMYCYRLMSKAGEKIFDFYPKANKTFMHEWGKWFKPGLKFIIERFIDGKRF